MELTESGNPGLGHIGLQPRRISLAQIDHYESIEHVRKRLVHIEGQDRTANFQVLFQQYRNPFAISFDLSNRLREFINIEQVTDDRKLPLPEFSSWSE